MALLSLVLPEYTRSILSSMYSLIAFALKYSALTLFPLNSMNLNPPNEIAYGSCFPRVMPKKSLSLL